MLDHLSHLLSWGAHWPGSPAALGLGLAATLWTSGRPKQSLVPLAAVAAVAALASGAAPFVGATALLVALGLVLSRAVARLEGRWPRLAPAVVVGLGVLLVLQPFGPAPGG